MSAQDKPCFRCNEAPRDMPSYCRPCYNAIRLANYHEKRIREGRPARRKGVDAVAARMRELGIPKRLRPALEALAREYDIID